MWRRYGIIGLAVIAQALVGAARPASAETMTVNQVSDTHVIEGTITRLDLQSSPATIEMAASDGKSYVVALDPAATMITREGKSVQREELAVGRPVRVRVNRKAGQDTAAAVELLPPRTRTSARTTTVVEERDRRQVAADREYLGADRVDYTRRTTTERRTLTGRDSIDRDFRRVETVRTSDLAMNSSIEWPIVPNATSRPGASITGPLVQYQRPGNLEDAQLFENGRIYFAVGPS